MNPAKKYMPNNRNITDEDDIKLVPFTTGRPTPSNDQSPFSMSTTGWIPVYFFDNATFTNMGPGMGSPGMGIPKMGVPGMGAPGMGTPGMGIPGMGSPGMGTPGMGSPGMGAPGMGAPGMGAPGMGAPGTTSPVSPKGSSTLRNLPNMDNTYATNINSPSEKFYPYIPLMNPSNRELPNIIQLLSDFDLDLDEDVDLVRNCSDKSIDKIYEKIEKNHPEIFALVKAYNIPCPIFKLLIRRVIKISMNYCKREGE